MAKPEMMNGLKKAALFSKAFWSGNHGEQHLCRIGD